MADVPKLFGRPGTFDDDTWVWESGSEDLGIRVYLAQFAEHEWEATVWVDGNHVHMDERSTPQEALAEAEEYLTRLAAGLDAMGVPRG